MLFERYANYEKVSFEIPDEDWEEIVTKTAHWDDPEQGYECMDNFRVCLIGNAMQEAIYAAAEEQGCCGYADIVVTCTSGKQYQVGCNYGH